MGVNSRVRIHAATAHTALLALVLLCSPLFPAEPDPVRVLYLEGELRSETKFLRRALEDDERFLLGSIVLTRNDATDRAPFSDQDVSAKALQDLDVLILGSVARSDFSGAQVEAIVTWVQEGGSVLLLGGRRALAHGDWKDSPLDPLLPIEPMSKTEVTATIQVADSLVSRAKETSRVNAEIEALKRRQQELKEQIESGQMTQSEANRRLARSEPAESPELRQKRQELTRKMEQMRRAQSERDRASSSMPRAAGGSEPEPTSLRPRLVENSYRPLALEPEPSAHDHPAFDFDESAVDFFDGLPMLASHQLEAQPRDEATVLLRDRDDPSFAALSYREHGKGVCAVLAAADTWRWQMQTEGEDARHASFWQTLLAWLGQNE